MGGTTKDHQTLDFSSSKDNGTTENGDHVLVNAEEVCGCTSTRISILHSSTQCLLDYSMDICKFLEHLLILICFQQSFVGQMGGDLGDLEPESSSDEEEEVVEKSSKKSYVKLIIKTSVIFTSIMQLLLKLSVPIRVSSCVSNLTCMLHF